MAALTNTTIEYTPIGIIHTPFAQPKGTPIQSKAALGNQGSIEVYQEYAEGLKDIEGFSHLMLIYHFHMSNDCTLTTTPFLDNNSYGVFATRVPSRPNSIGFSIVKLNKVDNNILYIENLDIVDNTPLLDIKPYVPDFDIHQATEIGWFDKKFT